MPADPQPCKAPCKMVPRRRRCDTSAFNSQLTGPLGQAGNLGHIVPNLVYF